MGGRRIFRYLRWECQGWTLVSEDLIHWLSPSRYPRHPWPQVGLSVPADTIDPRLFTHCCLPATTCDTRVTWGRDIYVRQRESTNRLSRSKAFGPPFAICGRGHANSLPIPRSRNRSFYSMLLLLRFILGGTTGFDDIGSKYPCISFFDKCSLCVYHSAIIKTIAYRCNTEISTNS